jgi:hypothetical protein
MPCLSLAEIGAARYARTKTTFSRENCLVATCGARSPAIVCAGHRAQHAEGLQGAGLRC